MVLALERLVRGLLRHLRPVTIGLGAAALAVLFVLPQISSAQSLTPDELRMLQRSQGNGDTVDTPSPVKPQTQTFTPATLPLEGMPLSRLEDLYRARAGALLRQFGYDSLGAPASVSISQSGAVPPAYVLGRTDEIVVTLRGQENATYRTMVDRDGRVTLPRLNPILAAGRTFGDFRDELETLVASAYVSTKVFVTLGSIHQVSILVSGEVRSPGVRIISAFASPLDAILLSGGIKKSGSLRSIRVVNGVSSRTIDLYSVVAQGASAQLGFLRDGDKIYVPPLGATAAVAGSVSRPGIFELPAGTTVTTVSGLLRLAGGVEIAGSYNLAKVALQPNGGLIMTPTNQNATIRSGEVLMVSASRSSLVGRVNVWGAVSVAGARPLALVPTLEDIFRSAADLRPPAYTPLAIIKRRDSVTGATTLVPVSIDSALRRTASVALRDDDLIFVFSREQAMALANIVTSNVNAAYMPAMNAGPLAFQRSGQGAGQNGSQGGGQTGEQGQVDPNAASGNRNSDTWVAPEPRSLEQLGTTTGAPATGTNQLPNGQGDSTQSEPITGDDPRFLTGGSGASSEGAALARAQSLAARNGRTGHTGELPGLTDEQIVSVVADQLKVTNDALQRVAIDNLVWVLDEVREPGPYLAAKGTSVEDMIQASGGVQLSADLSAIEVTSTEIDQDNGLSRTSRNTYSRRDGQMKLVSIQPLDVIRLRPVYSDRDEGTVSVAGQVRYPGVFDITRDERLSSVLQRAGGLSEVAYPYGAIFTRKEAALTERAGNERSARELETQIPELVSIQNSALDSTGQTAAGAYLMSLVRSLREMPTLGRIVITADPTVLATRPELDLVLQPGDTLYIPKRPSNVTVSGEVLNPGSFQYKPGLHYIDYIRMAGGVTQTADDGRVFIVLPDGSASPVGSDLLTFAGADNLPPGSTVVVPRDLRPFNWTQFLKDASQIISQLAITAASLSVLSKN